MKNRVTKIFTKRIVKSDVKNMRALVSNMGLTVFGEEHFGFGVVYGLAGYKTKDSQDVDNGMAVLWVSSSHEGEVVNKE